MCVSIVRSPTNALPPHTLLQELAARHRTALPLPQQPQHRGLLRRQRVRLPVAHDGERGEIDAHRTEHELLDQRRVGPFAPPQHRLDPRQQLAQRERLGHVVVGAELEPEHLVAFVAARGQQQHRGLAVARPQLAQQFEPARAGQHHVEHDEVEALAAQQRARFVAVGRAATTV